MKLFDVFHHIKWFYNMWSSNQFWSEHFKIYIGSPVGKPLASKVALSAPGNMGRLPWVAIVPKEQSVKWALNCIIACANSFLRASKQGAWNQPSCQYFLYRIEYDTWLVKCYQLYLKHPLNITHNATANREYQRAYVQSWLWRN